MDGGKAGKDGEQSRYEQSRADMSNPLPSLDLVNGRRSPSLDLD